MNPSHASNGIERPPITQAMSVQGPIGRSVADVRAGLTVMSARDSRDPLWVAASDNGRVRGDQLTVGIAVNPFGTALDPAVEKAMTIASQGLRDAGISVRDVAPPNAAEMLNLWGALLFTETEYTGRAMMEATGSPDMQRYFETFSARYELLDTPGYIAAMQRRVVLQRLWAQMFDEVDLVLMPTSLMRPFPNDQDFKDPDKLPGIIDAQAPLCAVNLLGLPAVAVPTHLEGTTPLGVQLIGPIHDDWFVLDVAEKLEREIGTIWQKLPDPVV